MKITSIILWVINALLFIGLCFSVLLMFAYSFDALDLSNLSAWATRGYLLLTLLVAIILMIRAAKAFKNTNYRICSILLGINVPIMMSAMVLLGF
jgi:hypothetical protein